MDIQQFLTLVINTLVLTSIIFFLLDFSFFLLDVWQQLSPSPQTEFDRQLKALLWDDDTQLAL